MKTLLIFYRIISFILVPIALLLALVDIFALFAALANPEFLLGIFVLACVVIYTFTSFNFLMKGILNGKPCKHSLRDWIRVNAFVSLVFVALTFMSSTQFLTDPVTRQQVIDQTMKMQSASASGLSKSFMNNFMNGVLYFMIVYSVLLLAHIFMSFFLLKQYKNLFDSNQV